MEYLRIALEIGGVLVLAILSLDKFADFRYKELAKKIIVAAKDAKITEEEFQDIATEGARVIWGNKPVPTTEEAREE